MKKLSVIFTLLCSISYFAAAEQLPRKTAKEAGYSDETLKQLEKYLEQRGSSSMILMHDGKVFFEWGDTNKKHTVHSIRKALINSLIGIYNQKGILPLNKTLQDYAIQDIDPLSKQELSATLKQLLQSRSGVYHPAAAESEGMKQLRPERHANLPGEFYYYNNWDFNVVGAILEKETGKSIYELFLKNIAKPLGMKFQGKSVSLDVTTDPAIPNADGFYLYEPKQSKFPAYHFRLSAKDLALYGQLYLNRGNWNDKQIIPEAWIDLTTRPHSVYNQKYGLAYGMFWASLVPSEDNKHPPSFFHTGTGVHMLGVYPKHKLVMVHRVDTESDYRFKSQDLYPLIRLMHQARLVK
jgi:CubicO group peptidase (beta-lactamase class C family)